jgi:cell division protein FtsQ
MWLKRKRKNRRLRREHLLEVKLNSQQVRTARLRFASIAASIFCAVLFVGFVFWRGGEWLLNRFIYENPAFTIRLPIEVSTDGVIAPEHFRRWAMIKPGQNLLALDLARVKRDLELVPIIESASVERILPNTLRLRVSEREPVAQVQSMQLMPNGTVETVVYQLDEKGFVFKPLDPRLRSKISESNEQLPIISGVDARELKVGRQVESEQIRSALRLLQEFDHSSMFGLVELLRIDVSAPETLRAFTGQGSEVTFGLAQLDQQLSRWRLIYDQSQHWGKAIGSIDLSVSNNVPLKLVEATPATTARPKNVKPTRTKKKNV